MSIDKKREKNESKALNKGDVSGSLSFKDIGELADKWLDDEILKEPIDRFTNREKYLMIEGFIEGYKSAQKKRYEKGLKIFGLRFEIWKVVQGYRLSIDTKTTRYIFKPFWCAGKCKVDDLI